MNLPRLIKFIVLFACVAVFFTPAVFAQTPITIDTTFLTPDTNASSVPQFISKFYELGLGIAGIIAVGMIVVGAIFYTISGASPQKKGEAKDIIFSAIWGVVLLFGSYVILKSINPQLIELRDPGSGLGGELPSPMDTGNCSSTTPIVDANGNPSPNGATLNPCAEGEPPINPETGYCQCYKREITPIACPIELEPVSYRNDDGSLPIYRWTISGEKVNSTNTHPPGQTSAGDNICARKVLVPEHTDFYTVDCDPCEEGWPSSGFFGYADDEHNFEKNTTGWVWPYYPKLAGGSVETAPQYALCVMYAYYDPEDEEIVRADLDGLKPCVEFSSSTPRATGNYEQAGWESRNNEVLQRLQNAGISVTSSGNCGDPNNPSCTNVGGLPDYAVDQIIYIKQNCNCEVRVTGGAETGHQSHGLNRPVFDLASNQTLAQYLFNNRTGNGLGFVQQICTTNAYSQYRFNCGSYTEAQEHLHVKTGINWSP